MIQTKRLTLRPWKISDWEPFYRMNADPEIMQYFPSTLNTKQSDEIKERIENHHEQYGYGPWAAVLKEDGRFVGFIGLFQVSFDSFFTPAVEIGWRLDKSVWNQGIATEGARACLRFGFDQLGLKRIVSITSVHNHSSKRVMQKIGMYFCSEFHNPNLPEDHWLSKHVLYEKRVLNDM